VWGISGLPEGLTANAAGEIIGTPTRSGTVSVGVLVVDANGTRSEIVFPLVVRPQPLAITTANVPQPRVGDPYSVQLGAVGGAAPYRWGISAGSLPPGLSIAQATGIISGTPTQAGSFQFTAQVSDANGQNAVRSYSVVVRPPVLAITTSSLGAATIGAPFSATLAASGGAPGYRWSASGLPPGFSLNSTTGVLTGTPTQVGTSSVSVRVMDQDEQSADRTMLLTVSEPLVITTTVGPLVVGSPVEILLSATGGNPPVVWSVSSGALPPGLSLVSQARLTITRAAAEGDTRIVGTPTTPGDFSFTLTATDSNGLSASRSFSVQVTSPLTISTSTAPAGRVGTPYELRLAASGGTLPVRWSISGGNLPAGISLDGATGAINGTPTVPGTFQFTARASDAANPAQSVERAFTVQIGLPEVAGVTITTPPNPQAGQQGRVGLNIDSPFPVDVAGTLVLTFAPNAVNNADDPAIQFSAGGRSVPFTIPAGQTQAMFRVPDLGVQTGTTAGTITLTATLTAGGAPLACTCTLTQTIVVPRTAPSISSVRATRTSTGFGLVITGFTTTREITQGVFRFSGGTALQTTELTVPLAASVNSFFQGAGAAQFGGQFVLTVPFTIQGDTTAVTSVTVTLTNAAGTSQPVTAAF
jgi:hypothetical protein